RRTSPPRGTPRAPGAGRRGGGRGGPGTSIRRAWKPSIRGRRSQPAARPRASIAVVSPPVEIACAPALSRLPAAARRRARPFFLGTGPLFLGTGPGIERRGPRLVRGRGLFARGAERGHL